MLQELDLFRFAALLSAVFCCSVSPGAAEEADTVPMQVKEIVGYVERVQLYPGGKPFRAKLDTGARTSSVDVRDMEFFTRDGKRWVRFVVETNTDEGIELERPVIRTSIIKRAGVEKEERPVVRLGVCLGHYYKRAEFNLTQRPGMNYRILLGRRFLSDQFLIDPSKAFLAPAECVNEKKAS